MTRDFFSGLKHTVNFYIVRHGQSAGNAAKILQGRGEYPLSDEGRLQAAERSAALRTALADTAVHKTMLFSSPQARARETAQIIAAQIIATQIIAADNSGSGPVYLDELMEMSLGVWTGKTWDEVRNSDPSLWSAFMARSWDAIPEAESSVELYDRALRAWAALRNAAIESGAENIVAVTHGGLIQWLLKTTFRCSSWFPLLPISNCGQFKLCVKPHPTEKCAYMCWEEIDFPLQNQGAQGQGFPA